MGMRHSSFPIQRCSINRDDGECRLENWNENETLCTLGIFKEGVVCEKNKNINEGWFRRTPKMQVRFCIL